MQFTSLSPLNFFLTNCIIIMTAS